MLSTAAPPIRAFACGTSMAMAGSGAARVHRRRRIEEQRIDPAGIAPVEEQGQNRDDECAQAGKREGEVKGQRPDAEPVVQVRFLQPARSAKTKVERVPQQARMP